MKSQEKTRDAAHWQMFDCDVLALDSILSAGRREGIMRWSGKIGKYDFQLTSVINVTVLYTSDNIGVNIFNIATCY